MANSRRKSPNFNGLDPSLFGLVLASLWGESRGTLGTLLLSFKIDFLHVQKKNDELFILDNVLKLSKTMAKILFFTWRDPAGLT
jgi:hypothetical protein